MIVQNHFNETVEIDTIERRLARDRSGEIIKEKAKEKVKNYDDNYDMIETDIKEKKLVRIRDHWNSIKVRMTNGQTEYWNYDKFVEYNIDFEWDE